MQKCTSMSRPAPTQTDLKGQLHSKIQISCFLILREWSAVVKFNKPMWRWAENQKQSVGNRQFFASYIFTISSSTCLVCLLVASQGGLQSHMTPPRPPSILFLLVSLLQRRVWIIHPSIEQHRVTNVWAIWETKEQTNSRETLQDNVPGTTTFAEKNN